MRRPAPASANTIKLMPNHHSAPNSRPEVKAALRSREMAPSRSMGQNFMTDEEVAAWIVDQLDIRPEDTVLEIGPGLGALTQHIIGRPKRLFLLEKDRRLAARLRDEVLKDAPGEVEVIEGDGMDFDIRPFFKYQPFKVIGALPYSVGTEIVRNVTRTPSPVSRAVFVLQHEVIQRICAKESGDGRSYLSVKVEGRWEASYLRKLPPDIFVPRPKVDSAVGLLVPRKRASLPTFDEAVLDRLLRLGFSQKRKMLRKLLPELPVSSGHTMETLAAEAGFLPTARAEDLSLLHWIHLARMHDAHALADVPQKDDEIFDVVDEHNNVVRQEKRKVVHAEKLIHRAVHVFVFNKAGELLLQKRSHRKDSMPERWDSSASGHLDAGEGYLTAAVRELEEELGLTAPPENFHKLALIPPSEATGMEWVELYGVWEYEGKVHFPAAEIECVRAFPLSEIDPWIAAQPKDWATGFIECWRAWDKERPSLG